jgi:hypothetical protein
MRNPFRYFNSSPEVIRLAVMMYIRYPLSLRQVEDLLFERGIDICHETVRYWWNRFALRCSPRRSGNDTFITGRIRDGPDSHPTDSTQSPPNHGVFRGALYSNS